MFMPGKRKSLRGVDGMEMLSTERPERREMTAANSLLEEREEAILTGAALC